MELIWSNSRRRLRPMFQSSRTRQRRLNEKRTRLWFEAAGPGPAAPDQNSLPGGHSEREPPDPIPNSEVKTLCADGSVPLGHARVGHCQALYEKTPAGKPVGVFLFGWAESRLA